MMHPIADKLLKLLKHRPSEAITYFSQVALGDSVHIKYGFDKDGVNISFAVYGERRLQDLCISKKLDGLFRTDQDLSRLDEYLSTINEPEKIFFSPYLKITDQPLMYVGQIGVNHNESEDGKR